MTLPKVTLPIAKKLISMILVAMFCVLVGCSVTEGLSAGGFAERMRMLYKVDIQFAHPPANDALAETTQLFIKSNEARTATTTQAFTSELQQARIGEARYFSQVEFTQENSAPQSQPLFEIVVDKPDIYSRQYQESRVRCPGDGAIRTCSGDEGYHYKVSCTEKQATLVINYTITDSKGEVIIPMSQHTETVSDSVCSDEQGGIASSESLIEAVLIAGGKNLATKFTPDFKKRPNDLFIKSLHLEKDKHSHLKTLRKTASEGDIDLALGGMKKLTEAYPTDGNLLFNAGYLNQAIGNFQAAKAFYQQAGAAGVSKPKRLAKHSEEVDAWLLKGIEKISKY